MKSLWKTFTMVLMVVALLAVRHNPAPADFRTMDPAGASAIPSTRPPVEPGRAVFIGDSFTEGVGGDGQRWTTLFAKKNGWDEVNLGNGGTGYASSLKGAPARYACGANRCPNYVQAAAQLDQRRPQVVIISGGRNDLGHSMKEIDTNSKALYASVTKQVPKAKCYVVSPFWSATPYPDWLERISGVLRKNARSASCTYLEVGSPLTGHPELIIADSVHPTARGYAVLANEVQNAYLKAR